jgi:hypothetical protein
MPATLEHPPLIQRRFTAAGVARLYGVGMKKVLRWIREGELEAVNLATSADERRMLPRWSISAEALAAFERRRGATTNAKPPRKRR